MNNKSLWQKIYSSLGFWKYYAYDEHGRWCIVYWCCFPFYYIRKFDIIRVKAKLQY